MADGYIDKVEVGAKIQMMYIRREMDYGGENDFCRGMRKALRIIEHTPAADVQSVRYGKWISHGGNCYECSNCHNRIYQKRIHETHDHDFCGRCGADMRGDKNG